MEKSMKITKIYIKITILYRSIYYFDKTYPNKVEILSLGTAPYCTVHYLDLNVCTYIKYFFGLNSGWTVKYYYRSSTKIFFYFSFEYYVV